MKQTIFDNDIFTTTVTNLETFDKHSGMFLKQMLNLSISVPMQDHVQSRGEATTTVQSADIFRNLPGFRLLQSALMNYLEEAKHILFPESSGKLELIRAWANIMHKGSTTVSHHHQVQADPYMVCIFYLEAPAQSAQLAIINDSTQNLECIDFPEEKLHYISPHPHMLLCHRNHITHAVSEHLSDDRRISIMLEMAFNPK